MLWLTLIVVAQTLDCDLLAYSDDNWSASFCHFFLILLFVWCFEITYNLIHLQLAKYQTLLSI